MSLGSGEVDIVEVEVPRRSWWGARWTELTMPGEVHVVAITRGGRTFLPTLGTVFQQGGSAPSGRAGGFGRTPENILGLS